MRAVDFPHRNLMLAEDQPEYETLPVFVEIKEMKVLEKGETLMKNLPWSMIACFELSDREIEELVKTRKLWYRQCLFGNNFQPMHLSTEDPFV